MAHRTTEGGTTLSIASGSSDNRTVSRFARWVSAVVIAATFVVLLGWALGIPVLASFVRGGVTMKANTAFGLLFGALALWFLAAEDNTTWAYRLGQLCASITTAIGLWTVAECQWPSVWNIDELVFRATTDIGRTATPGRMAVSTALTFALLGLSLLTLDVNITRRFRLSQVLTALGLVVPLTTLLGYAYVVIPFVGLGQGVQMAVHTAVCLVLLDIGLFYARPTEGMMQTLTSHRSGGVIARRLLPYAFIIPLVLGALRLAGETAGLYSVPLGSAYTAVATMLILSVLIWRTAHELNRADEVRERTALALSTEQHARVEADSARSRAEEAERRLAIIAEASQLLASSLDAQVLLERLAWLTVPSLADWCFIDLVEEHGTWQRVAIAYADPQLQDLAAKFRRQFRMHGGRRYDTIGMAQQEPETHNVPNVTDDLVRALAQDDEHLATLRELQMKAYVSVPLTIRDRVAGAITFVCTQERPPYTPAVIALIEELARRCSMAVDNARLYQGALAGAQTKVEFLATISHELRTPLTAIVGYTALLEEEIFGEMTPPQMEQMSHIHRSADHLLELIDDILTFSKLEAGRVSVANESVIVADALEEAAGLVAQLVAQRGLTLTVERPTNFMILETDATKLRQILVNLLSNAAKFTERGTIKLRAWVDDPSIVFEVRDTGIGIAPEDSARVFEAFTQLDQRLTRTVGGLGLGLGVAQRLATVLGGEITLASRPGHGSTFFVRLPYPKHLRDGVWVDEQAKKA